uniref:Uncharacterized protein n=1 Tax=Leersia perrieri TaxID=77586 RepID=A0A0D9V426_9ORYZ
MPAPAPAAGYSAGMKRPLAAALHNHRIAAAAAAAERRWQRREAIRAKRGGAPAAGALVPYVAPPPPIDAQPMHAVPHAAVAPKKPKKAAAEARPPVEPEWIRDLLFEELRLTRDQPLVFIGERKLTWSDLKDHQNRFRLPTLGVQQRLLPMLTLDEAKAAHLLKNNEEGLPMPMKRRRPEKEINVVEGITDAPDQPRKKGKEHGGLPVTVMHGNDVEGKRELQLVVWESTNGAVIKGNGYMDFIKRTQLKEHDVVQIWAFKRREFRFFGVNVEESPLYLLIVRAPVDPPVPLI